MLTNKILDKARKLVEKDLQDEVARIEKERAASRVAAVPTIDALRQRVIDLKIQEADVTRRFGPVVAELRKREADMVTFQLSTVRPLQAESMQVGLLLAIAEGSLADAERARDAESRRIARLLAAAAEG